MSLKIYVKLYDLNWHLLYVENQTMDLKEMLSLQTNMNNDPMPFCNKHDTCMSNQKDTDAAAAVPYQPLSLS